MHRICPTLCCAMLVTGCALRPLPDGSHIERLSEAQLAKAAPPVSPEQKERLQQLDAQLLAQQERAAQQETWERQIRLARQKWELDYSPGWLGPAWGWGGAGWRRWDGWRNDFVGPWPY